MDRRRRRIELKGLWPYKGHQRVPFSSKSNGHAMGECLNSN